MSKVAVKLKKKLQILTISQPSENHWSFPEHLESFLPFPDNNRHIFATNRRNDLSASEVDTGYHPPI